jgi:hypothetical protein
MAGWGESVSSQHLSWRVRGGSLTNKYNSNILLAWSVNRHSYSLDIINPFLLRDHSCIFSLVIIVTLCHLLVNVLIVAS